MIDLFCAAIPERKRNPASNQAINNNSTMLSTVVIV